MIAVWILITYLIVAVVVFVYGVTVCRDTLDYSSAVFLAVFYPLVIVIWMLVPVVSIVYGLVHELIEAVKRLKVRSHKDE